MKKKISEMTDEELERRALELTEKKHREYTRNARFRMILIVILIFCLFWAYRSFMKLGEGLDTTSTTVTDYKLSTILEEV